MDIPIILFQFNIGPLNLNGVSPAVRLNTLVFRSAAANTLLIDFDLWDIVETHLEILSGIKRKNSKTHIIIYCMCSVFSFFRYFSLFLSIFLSFQVQQARQHGDGIITAIAM